MDDIDWGQNSVKVISAAVRITFKTQLITVFTLKEGTFNSHYTPDVLFGSLNEDAGKRDFNLPPYYSVGLLTTEHRTEKGLR